VQKREVMRPDTSRVVLVVHADESKASHLPFSPVPLAIEMPTIISLPSFCSFSACTESQPQLVRKKEKENSLAEKRYNNSRDFRLPYSEVIRRRWEGRTVRGWSNRGAFFSSPSEYYFSIPTARTGQPAA
jgi:hypothetical protein